MPSSKICMCENIVTTREEPSYPNTPQLDSSEKDTGMSSKE